MPIIRHRMMQQYLIQDSGIGSTVHDIDAHLNKAVLLLSNSRYDEAKEELSNLRYSFFSTLSGLDFKTRAFVCLITKILTKKKKGRVMVQREYEVKDLSAEGMTAVVKMLEESGITSEEIEKHWEQVKKKLILNSEPISLDGSEMTLNTLKT